MSFSERLKHLRTSRKLTQRALAEILSYGSTAISNYESGRNEPSIADLTKIAEYFDVSLDYLLCVTDVKAPFSVGENKRQVQHIDSFLFRLKPENLKSVEHFVAFLYHLQETKR